MTKMFLARIFGSLSDNPKSKIQNLKWLGLSVIAFVLVVTGAVAMAQQPAKILRIGILIAPSASSFSARVEALRRRLRELGYVEGKSTDMQKGKSNGFLTSRPSWSVSKLTSSSPPAEKGLF